MIGVSFAEHYGKIYIRQRTSHWSDSTTNVGGQARLKDDLNVACCTHIPIASAGSVPFSPGRVIGTHSRGGTSVKNCDEAARAKTATSADVWSVYIDRTETRIWLWSLNVTCS